MNYPANGTEPRLENPETTFNATDPYAHAVSFDPATERHSGTQHTSRRRPAGRDTGQGSRPLGIRPRRPGHDRNDAPAPDQQAGAGANHQPDHAERERTGHLRMPSGREHHHPHDHPLQGRVSRQKNRYHTRHTTVTATASTNRPRMKRKIFITNCKPYPPAS